MGWGTIIYLAAITGISGELYEAAMIDGANRWQRMWNITLPGIRGTVVTLLIMNLGKVMEVTTSVWISLEIRRLRISLISLLSIFTIKVLQVRSLVWQLP